MPKSRIFFLRASNQSGERNYVVVASPNTRAGTM